MLGAFALLGILSSAALANTGTPSFSGVPGTYAGWVNSEFTLTVTASPARGGLECWEYDTWTNDNWLVMTNTNGNQIASGSSGTAQSSFNIYNDGGPHYFSCVSAASGFSPSNDRVLNGGTGSNTDYGWNTDDVYVDFNSPNINPQLSGGSYYNGWYTSYPGINSNVSANGPSGIASAPCYQEGPGVGGGDYYYCTATTGAGLSVAANSPGFNYDPDAPAVSVGLSGGAGQNGWYYSAPSVYANVSAGPSGVASESCSGLANGANSVTCYATDNNGLSSSGGATVYLDNVTPTVGFSGGGSAWYSSISSIPAISASAATGPSGLASLTCSGDGIASQSISSGANLNLSGLNSGTGTISCSGTSVAGLTGSAAYTIHYDPTPPPAPTISSSASSSTWYGSASAIPTITATDSDSVSGIASVSCSNSLNSDSYSALSSSATAPYGDLSNGVNVLTCSATSNAGVVGPTSTSFSVKLDNSVPPVPALNVVSGANWVSTPAASPVTATAGLSGVASITCTDSNNANVYTVNAASGSIPASYNTNGTNNWSCITTDGAGIQSAGDRASLFMDNITPTVVLPANSTSYAKVAANLSVSATVGPSGFSDPTCTNSANNDTYTFEGSGSIPATDEAQGTNTWTCVATSNSGETSGPQTFTYELDSSSPTMDQPVVANQWFSTPPSIPVSASDTVGIASISCSNSLNSDTYSVNAASGAIPAADESNGANSWTCHAVNDGGVSSNNVSVTEEVDSSSPTVSWASTSSAYSTTTSEQLNVVVGDSGMAASPTCTDNGSSVTLTASGSNPSSGSGTYSYTVPTTLQGANSMACSVSNGDSSPALIANSPAQTFNVDTTSPTVSVASTSGFQSMAKALAVSSTVGSSGIANVSCSDSNNSNTYTTTSASGSIPAADMTDGTNTWTCQVVNGEGVASALASGTEELDDTVPTMTVPVTNATWLTSPVALPVGASGGLSGLASITCSDSNNSNSYSTTSNDGTIPASDNTNGANIWTCYSTDNAGVNSPNATVTENLDNLTPSVAFATQASQSTTYPLESSVPTIKVNGTTGPSGLEAITCSGDGISPATYDTLANNVINLSTVQTGSGTITCNITSNSGLTASTAFNLTVAATTKDSTVGRANIQGTVLAITAPSAISFSGELDGNDLVLNDATPADQSLTAEDATGSFNGWNITAQASGAFSDGSATLPANALSLNSDSSSSLGTASPAEACIVNSTCTLATNENVTYPVVIPSTGSGAAVYDAAINSGMGTMNVNPLQWWLNVPGNALAGVYTTTVTLSINSGPAS